MPMISTRQYQNMLEARARGDQKEVDRILAGGTIIDVEIDEPVEDKPGLAKAVELPDAETIEDKLAAGMSKADVGKEYGVSHQKIANILKASK